LIESRCEAAQEKGKDRIRRGEKGRGKGFFLLWGFALPGVPPAQQDQPGTAGFFPGRKSKNPGGREVRSEAKLPPSR